MRTRIVTVLGTASLLGLVAWGAAPPAKLADALAAQRSLATERPGDPGVLNDLGNLLALAGESREAEELYRRALDLEPGNTAARYNLALLLHQRGEEKAALREYRQLIEEAPDHAWAHFQIGLIHASRGLASLAIEHYARAFRLDPQLAFPDVNPQVIGNPLMTPALLRAHRGSAPPLAPRIYQQPSHVAGLLLPALPAGGGEAEAPGEERREIRTSWPATEGEEGAEEPPAGPTPEAGERTLSRRDFTERKTGQVTGGGTPGTPAPRGGFRVPGRRSHEPQGSAPDVQARPDAPGAGAPAPFLPGRPSTGRLEIRLLPAELAPAGP